MSRITYAAHQTKELFVVAPNEAILAEICCSVYVDA